MEINYVAEKFATAVLTLAQSQASLKEKICNAYFSIHSLNENHLPERCEEKYKLLMETLTAQEAIGDEGNLRATLNKMSEQKLKDIIKEICSISREIDRTYTD